jgi:hypothetical protein
MAVYAPVHGKQLPTHDGVSGSCRIQPSGTHVFEKIAEGFARCELLVPHPVCHEVGPILAQRDSAHLHTLHCVQAALLQQGPEIDNKWRLLAGNGWRCLQARNGGLRAQRVIWRARCCLGRLLELALGALLQVAARLGFLCRRS